MDNLTKKWILFGILFVILSGAVATVVLDDRKSGTTYYVDAALGDDSNNGTNVRTPWKTLKKVNQIEYTPGDQILLAADSCFTGTLAPMGNGSEKFPIRIDMYGDGNKPIINGSGGESACMLYGQSYWKISNLEVVNTGDTEADRRGIYIVAKGRTTHIQITDCNIHNVKGNNDFNNGKGTGGLICIGTGEAEDCFEDLLIENNIVEYCDRTGIYIGDACGSGEDYVNKKVVVRNNIINYPGGDGVILNGVDAALVEYNIVNTTDYVSNEVSAGIWPWYSKERYRISV